MFLNPNDILMLTYNEEHKYLNTLEFCRFSQIHILDAFLLKETAFF